VVPRPATRPWDTSNPRGIKILDKQKLCFRCRPMQKKEICKEGK